jgi:hypothetical protein
MSDKLLSPQQSQDQSTNNLPKNERIYGPSFDLTNSIDKQLSQILLSNLQESYNFDFDIDTEECSQMHRRL